MDSPSYPRTRFARTAFLPGAATETGFCHCASLWEAPDGALTAVWYRYAEREHRDGSIMFARRSLNGAWGPASCIVSGSSCSYANPVLFSVGQRLGLVFMVLSDNGYWTNAVAFSCWSDNWGGTWSVPRPAGLGPGVMVRHPPVEVPGGLLLPAYDETTSSALFAFAASPYETWQEESRTRGAALIQPALVSGADGALTAFFRPAGESRCVWRSRTLNARRDWSTPVRTPLPSPPSGVAAVSLGGDAVLVAYNHSLVHRRTPLVFALSPDNGLRWDAAELIDDNPFELSYPALLRTRDGAVHGIYTHERRRLRHFEIRPQELPGVR